MIPNIAKIIIEGDPHPVRFESFCIEMCQRVEGILLVPTSRTYDRGRDGRSPQGILCATLSRSIDDKIKKDITRLVETSAPQRVIYCCSQELTEDKIDKIAAEMRPLLPGGCGLVLYGSRQLAYFAEEKHPGIFEHFYAGEIKNIETRLLSFRTGEETAETRGLRLALAAFGSDEAVALRRTISTRAVLEVLKKVGRATTDSVSSALAADLGLPRPFNARYVAGVLDEARQAGLVDDERDAWILSPRGRHEADSIPPDAVKELLLGRAVIRETLEALIGVQVADTQFEQLWSTLLDVLSELFYTNGFWTISAVNDLIGAKASESRERSSLERLLSDGAKRVAALFRTPELSLEVEQAILDMFLEHSGPAFEWLAKVCERFVALCALGLEPASADEIRKVLRRHYIVLDSDIILTLLCEGEPDHTAAKELVATWRQLGGHILLATPVLEEVAHHAWISGHDFRQTEHLLGKLKGRDNLRYVENAFVRAYHSLERDGKKWPLYIDSFRGKSSSDYSKVLKTLRAELGADTLAEDCEPRLQKAVSEYLIGLRTRSPHKDPAVITGKAQHDGQLLACVAAVRARLARTGGEETVVILTSSTRLHKADRKFRQDIGEPNSVISLGAFSYLLSLVPDSGLGAATLRRALFEFGETAHLPDTERLAMRVIRGTENFNMPWARRVTLQDYLQRSLRKEADKRGTSDVELKKYFERPDRASTSAQLILESVQAMAIDDVKDEELKEAKRTIRLLENEKSQLAEKVQELTREIIGKS
jgi:hypothetical protein